jgi:hypothetical protein
MHEILRFLFTWVPGQNSAVVSHGLTTASLTSPDFLIACLPLAILCLLSIIPAWARLNDSPWIFTITHSLPFLALTFVDSLGDAGQVIDGVGARYHMSEPLASLTHYWFFRFLHEPFNIGAKDAIAWSTRAGGILYVFLIAKVSLRLYLDLTPTRRLVHRLLFLTAGVSLLCYGYIENPPLALPAEQLWILATLAFLASPSLINASFCAAALALATAVHGRVGFLFPALALGLIIPSGTFVTRTLRLFTGTFVYFGLLGAFLAYIFNIEPNHISGGHYGNVTGGGNRQMFVALSTIVTRAHWEPYLRSLLIAGGILVPIGLLRLVTMWHKPSGLDFWCLGYLLADILFLLVWEFDYGPYLDWDLVFSAVMPALLLTSRVLVPSRIPTLILLPFLLITVYLSNTYAVMVNGSPLSSTLVTRAGPPMTTGSCATSGLLRTYFDDPLLTNRVSAPEVDIPSHEYGPGGVQVPNAGRPVGATFDGFIKIAEPGRYRFFITGQRNVRMRIGDRTLVDKWIDYEWRVAAEREIRFDGPGNYPIRIEFFTTNQAFPLLLDIESARYPRRKITQNELCHD